MVKVCRTVVYAGLYTTQRSLWLLSGFLSLPHLRFGIVACINNFFSLWRRRLRLPWMHGFCQKYLPAAACLRRCIWTVCGFWLSRAGFNSLMAKSWSSMTDDPFWDRVSSFLLRGSWAISDHSLAQDRHGRGDFFSWRKMSTLLHGNSSVCLWAIRWKRTVEVHCMTCASR